MSDQNYPQLIFEEKSAPLLNHHDQNNVFGQPPTGYQNPPVQNPAPFQIDEEPVNENDVFKIKGLIELQSEFNAEEIKVVKKQPHVCSLLLNLMVLGSRGFVIVSFICHLRQKRFIIQFWYLFVLIELIYLIEFFCSNTLRYLWNKVSSDSIFEHVNKIKLTRPEISMWCECYHFETRIRYVTESYSVQGSNGPEMRTRQRMETYQEKVVTHTEKEHFEFGNFYEISRMISDDIYHNDMIKIKFGKNIVFGDSQTRNEYDRQLSIFISRNKHRDTCFSYVEYKEIPGFKDRMFSVNGEKHSCFVNWCWYIIFTLLGFTWFYRIWVESKCLRGEYNFHMIVFKDPHRYF